MHKYPSWVLKEMDDEINDELITDSNVDLLLNVTPRGSFASTRGKEREKKDLFFFSRISTTNLYTNHRSFYSSIESGSGQEDIVKSQSKG